MEQEKEKPMVSPERAELELAEARVLAARQAMAQVESLRLASIATQIQQRKADEALKLKAAQDEAERVAAHWTAVRAKEAEQVLAAERLRIAEDARLSAAFNRQEQLLKEQRELAERTRKASEEAYGLEMEAQRQLREMERSAQVSTEAASRFSATEGSLPVEATSGLEDKSLGGLENAGGLTPHLRNLFNRSAVQNAAPAVELPVAVPPSESLDVQRLRNTYGSESYDISARFIREGQMSSVPEIQLIEEHLRATLRK